MRREFVLVFECCGAEITLGYDRTVGNHGDHCLSCDTDNPETHVEREFIT